MYNPFSIILFPYTSSEILDNLTQILELTPTRFLGGYEGNSILSKTMKSIDYINYNNLLLYEKSFGIHSIGK